MSAGAGPARPLRILLATYWSLPHVGGVSSFVDLVSQELRQQGHAVDVLGHSEDMERVWVTNTGRYVEKKPVKDVVYATMLRFFNERLPLVDPWIRWREIERYTFEMCCLAFGVQNYDIIHTQDIVSTRAISRVRDPRTAHVATIHGLLATEYLASGEVPSRQSMPFAYARAEEYYGCTSADLTMVPAAWLRERMAAECGVPAGGLRVVPYGMDVEAVLARSRRLPEAVSGNRRRLTLVCPARMVSVKGHRVLLEAVAELSREFSLTLWLAGDGPLRPELEALTAERDLEDVVQFLGPRGDVPALLRMADIVVLPSIQDTLPFTVMESQVVGTPIVASRTGGIPEMIQDGRTGLLAEPGDGRDLAAKLRRLLRDGRLRRELGEAERAYGQAAWAPARLIERLLAAYREALARRGGSA